MYRQAFINLILPKNYLDRVPELRVPPPKPLEERDGVLILELLGLGEVLLMPLFEGVVDRVLGAVVLGDVELGAVDRVLGLVLEFGVLPWYILLLRVGVFGRTLTGGVALTGL